MSMNTQSEGVMVGGALMIAGRDIVDNALLANNVTTVVAAVKAAGLVDTLKSKGPFTVFAPTNAAFSKLPAGTVDTLLKPENKGKLVDILTYHVVAGRYTTSDLSDGQVLTTVEGKTLTIKKQGNMVWINGSAMIETPNVISSNGVTHVIDAVLLPKVPAVPTPADIALAPPCSSKSPACPSLASPKRRLPASFPARNFPALFWMLKTPAIL